MCGCIGEEPWSVQLGKDAAEAVYHAVMEGGQDGGHCFRHQSRLTMNPLLIRKHFSRNTVPELITGKKSVAKKGSAFRYAEKNGREKEEPEDLPKNLPKNLQKICQSKTMHLKLQKITI